jgi:hypothetical protein
MRSKPSSGINAFDTKKKYINRCTSPQEGENFNAFTVRFVRYSAKLTINNTELHPFCL